MANQETSEHDILILSLVSDIRNAHKKVEENFQKMEMILEETCRTDNFDLEQVQACLKKLINDRQELRKLMKENADSVFRHLRNKDTSSRLHFLNECMEKLKNLDLSNQETESGDYSGDQEKEECSNSSGYVAEGEIEKKDRTFLLDDSDTSSSSVEDKEVRNDEKVDLDMMIRFLEKAKTSSLSEVESEIEDFIDAFTNGSHSSNVILCEQEHFYFTSSSGDESSGNDADEEYSGDEGLLKDLKKQDEGEDK